MRENKRRFTLGQISLSSGSKGDSLLKVLSAQQMKEVDRLTTEKYGLPSLLLMENAGISLYLALKDYFGEKLSEQRTAIICGKGNNGGDGLVLARQLRQRETAPDVFLLAAPEMVAGDARINLDIYQAMGGQVQPILSEEEWSGLTPRLESHDLVVDAILGTGISKPMAGLHAQVAEDVNRLRAFVLSVDFPSGMVSDAFRGTGPAIRADATVTFTAPKIAHVLHEDQESLGSLHLFPIGTPPELLQTPDYPIELITHPLVSTCLPKRPASSHKGSFGHTVIVAGSRGKSGAAALATSAALRSGSGLVTACVPEAIQALVGSFRPEVMTEGLASTQVGTFASGAGDDLLEFLHGKQVAAIGPGVSTNPETVDFVHQVVQQARIPLVIDADGLNCFQGQRQQLFNNHDQPLVLTPHPGEFSRLIGKSTAEILDDKIELARRFAQDQHLWLVLKGFRTLIAPPDGRVFVCPLGNPGMATAGTGDVLTGIIASFLGQYQAQGLKTAQQTTQAVLAGVYLHSLAGDLAGGQTGGAALNASNIIEHLGAAQLELDS